MRVFFSRKLWMATALFAACVPSSRAQDASDGAGGENIVDDGLVRESPDDGMVIDLPEICFDFPVSRPYFPGEPDAWLPGDEWFVGEKPGWDGPAGDGTGAAEPGEEVVDESQRELPEDWLPPDEAWTPMDPTIDFPPHDPAGRDWAWDASKEPWSDSFEGDPGASDGVATGEKIVDEGTEPEDVGLPGDIEIELPEKCIDFPVITLPYFPADDEVLDSDAPQGRTLDLSDLKDVLLGDLGDAVELPVCDDFPTAPPLFDTERGDVPELTGDDKETLLPVYTIALGSDEATTRGQLSSQGGTPAPEPHGLLLGAAAAAALACRRRAR